MDQGSSDIVSSGGPSLNTATVAVRKVITDHWAIVVAVIAIFGSILWVLFDYQGRISALEAKLELYIELNKNSHKGG